MNAIFQRRIGAMVLWVLLALLLVMGQCRLWRESDDLSARAESPARAGGEGPVHFRM